MSFSLLKCGQVWLQMCPHVVKMCPLIQDGGPCVFLYDAYFVLLKNKIMYISDLETF